MSDLAGAAVAGAATIISLVFAGTLLTQFFQRRKPHQLAWSVGLFLFAGATFAEMTAYANGWSEGMYRFYYGTALPLTGFFGVGSVYFLRRTWGHGFSAYVLAILAVFLFFVATAPVNATELARTVAVGGSGWADPAMPRRLSPFFTIPGAIALLGVASYSYYRTRQLALLLLIVGIVPFIVSGSLARLGYPALITVGNLVGITLLFLGFLKTVEPAKVAKPAAAPAS